ncbi:MAG: alpha/beta fold hydrolase [Planctomycetes bacterium]|nr:alpha/beta fold hydrolase [Planctomycetota bacterium]
MSVLTALVCTLLAVQDPAPVPAPERQPEQADKNVERVTFSRGKKKVPLFMELTLANPDPKTPLLVLYHQARSSKGEYRPIVPHLKELGYNCLAVDLSFGGSCREVKNQAARAAPNATALDSSDDILDSLQWAREHHAQGKLVAWGSSFSASLVLVLAAQHAELVDGVIAFSPGEYFAADGKSASWVRESVTTLQLPAFVAAARGEERDWSPIFEAIPAAAKQSFVPTSPGSHGSRALWEESADHALYWAALEGFLKQHFPAPAAPAAPKDG